LKEEEKKGIARKLWEGINSLGDLPYSIGITQKKKKKTEPRTPEGKGVTILKEVIHPFGTGGRIPPGSKRKKQYRIARRFSFTATRKRKKKSATTNIFISGEKKPGDRGRDGYCLSLHSVMGKRG